MPGQGDPGDLKMLRAPALWGGSMGAGPEDDGVAVFGDLGEADGTLGQGHRWESGGGSLGGWFAGFKMMVSHCSSAIHV